VEEVNSILARLTLLTFCSSSVVAACQSDLCVSPRIKRAKACGVVIDPYGMRIPNARVEFGVGGSDSSGVSDNDGHFKLPTKGEEVHLTVGAPGFQSVETSIGRLRQGAGNCKKPLFVMLTISEQGCAMISLRKSDLLLAKKE